MNNVMEWQYKIGMYFFLLMVAFNTYGAPSANLYSAIVPSIKKGADPLIMLVMSVDHNLFKKAYSDYSDLDNDGVLDTTYNDAFDYAGYFDNQWCYSYNTTQGYYQPSVPSIGAHMHFCNTGSGLWSGNFLNWATMSRIDLLREVLFGGKRFKDTKEQTVLERTFLPKDLHAFAKVYRGTEVAPVSSLTPFNESSISLCNLTVTEKGPPIVRVASNAWPRWALTEEEQCQWAARHSPSSLDRLAEHNVYITSCVPDKDARNKHRCKRYKQGNHKPIGLLQRHGDAGNIQFGLISGSYDKNSSGGVLRKHIMPFAGHLDSSKDEINLDTGIVNTDLKGIIHHISTFRIAKYSYSTSRYLDCNLPNISVATFLSEPSRLVSSDRHCSNWGNPLAEMYLEALRYFSGAGQSSSDYDAQADHYFLPELIKEKGSIPQSGNNACASCSIIVLSSGANSFDMDEFSKASEVPGINGFAGVNQLTDDVGTVEAAINPKVKFLRTVFADKTGGSRQCEPVGISKLSDVRGICPEQPQLEGGYAIAGLAWHGRKADLRPDLDGQQFVQTYVVELAERLPSFAINVANRQVVFQPVCEAYGERNACALTDVIVDYLDADRRYGRFVFFWEDSVFGNDYDYDASSSIAFCVGSACSPAIDDDQIQFSVQQEAKHAGETFEYSYSITGTNNSGIVLPFAQGTGVLGDQGQGTAVVTTFDVLDNAAVQLPRPALLAAKYGSFIDLNNDATPYHDSGDRREWDNRNNFTGEIGADDLPDNYFFIQHAKQLALALGQELQSMVYQAAAIDNLAVIANTTSVDSTVYQSLFQPRLEHSGKTVTWGGMLYSLFIDDEGQLREDSNKNGRLDDFSQDSAIEIVNDVNTGQSMVQYYVVENGDRIPMGSLQPLSQLNPIWDARDSLARLANLTSQRGYGAIASSGRHILTWLDNNNNQRVDDNEIKPFIAESFLDHKGYLQVNQSQISDMVNYIRGEEIDGFRSRTIDYDTDGVAEVWRLGDIVHSKPAVVSNPSGAYDARFTDTSYKAYKDKYRHRRQVIYVGANDGLIHAFNGGFWNSNNQSYMTEGQQGETAHPLGAELWAYAPMNLLPHLRWLTEPDYPHVYYMDGDAKAFDVNIFSPDEDHPNGWGTVLVVGMGLGGGAIEMLVEDKQRIARSGYVVIDITNPEKPPVVLAEITAPSLGFTISSPALIKQRIAGNNDNWLKPAKNEWYLSFASGPRADNEAAIRTTLDQGVSQQNLQVFIYDLRKKEFVSGFDPLVTTYTNSYGGDMTAVDWNKDFQDDAVYFGSVKTLGTELSGAIHRLKINNLIASSSVHTLLETNQPMIAAPLTVADNNDYWIYGGTGRLLISGDSKSRIENSLYGIKEPVNVNGYHHYATVSESDLINTTNVIVHSSGAVQVKRNNAYLPMIIDESQVKSFDELKKVMRKYSGWKVNLFTDKQKPSGKMLSAAKRIFSMVLFKEYQPSGNHCLMDDKGYLHGLHYITGTSTPDAVMGNQHYNDRDDPISLSKVASESGSLEEIILHKGRSNKTSAFIQNIKGSIEKKVLNYKSSPSGRQSWRQIFEVH
ncbi:MAG: PilC/PilY family type IV pilus protein [Endozoicomonas sp. (ex Botrylloides leachii)]|nr:PilC/PilY family type IV pilus protein [Endozoicomonas sp. (ex Botrylloides leachii)]